MNVLWNKLTALLVTFICTLINTAICFLTDIIMFEVTEGVKFNWGKLLQNPWFWVVSIVNASHACFSIAMNRVANKNDDKAARVVQNRIADLYNTAGRLVKKGDYENAEKVLKMIGKFKKERDN